MSLIKWVLNFFKEEDSSVEIRSPKEILCEFYALIPICPDDPYVNLPEKTKTLSAKGTRIVVDFLQANREEIAVLYGSFALEGKLLPEVRRVPGDIDVLLKLDKTGAERFSKSLLNLLKNIGEPVRLNKLKPWIIESKVGDKWLRAVDIHHFDETPEDRLSPNAPLNYPVRKEHLLWDAIDTYAMMRTNLKFARNQNLSQAKLKEGERLIKEYKFFFRDLIDWEKLEPIAGAEISESNLSGLARYFPTATQKEKEEVEKNFEELQSSLNEIELSLSKLRELEKQNPTHWVYKGLKDSKNFTYRDKALNLAMLSENLGAIRVCEDGLKHYPGDAYLMYLTGRTLGDMAKYSQAIRTLSSTIKLYPTFADAYVERGHVLYKIGRKNDGLEDFRKARALEPDIQLPRHL